MVEVMELHLNSILSNNKIKIAVEALLMETQRKRNLLSELLEFDVLSLDLPAELLEGTDQKDLTEAKNEMQAYFKEGILLDR